MKYLIMHGSYLSAKEKWFGWIKEKLEAQNHEVLYLEFPTDDYDEITKIGPDNLSKYTPKQSLSIWGNKF